MRITCLAENTATDNRFGAEHGLSLYIETGAHAVVFDMGQTGLFAETPGSSALTSGTRTPPFSRTGTTTTAAG